MITITLAGMAAVTYLPRLLPAWLLSSRQLSPQVVRWLGYVPTAVLSAMLVPSLMVRNQSVDFSPDNIFLWAGLITLAAAWKTASFFTTVAVGMGLVALGRLVFGV